MTQSSTNVSFYAVLILLYRRPRSFILSPFLLFAFLSGSLPFLTSAQEKLGLTTGNYSPLTTMYANPAELVDCRREWSINFFNAEGYASSDSYKWAGGNPELMAFNGVFGGVNRGNPSFAAGIKKGDESGPFGYGVNFQGISLMFHQSGRLAFGFGTRSRVGVQFSDMTNIPDLSAISPGATNITNGSFDYKAASFSEISFQTAAVIWNATSNFIKAGVGVKALNSIFAENARFTQFNYSPGSTQATYSLHGDGVYFNGDRLEHIFNPVSLGTGGLVGNQTNYGSGFGFDFGVTYEYRPGSERNPVNASLINPDSSRNDINKYKFKISVSATDIGSSVSFTDSVKKYNVIVNNQKIANEAVDMVNPQSGLAGIAGARKGADTAFSVAIPSVFRFVIDYHLSESWYVNMQYTGILKVGDLNFGSSSYLAVTPRLETPYFEMALPITFRNGFKTNSVGGLIYIGNVFFLGSDDIFSNLVQKSTRHANLYAGFVIGPNRKKPIDLPTSSGNSYMQAGGSMQEGVSVVVKTSRPRMESVRPFGVQTPVKLPDNSIKKPTDSIQVKEEMRPGVKIEAAISRDETTAAGAQPSAAIKKAVKPVTATNDDANSKVAAPTADVQEQPGVAKEAAKPAVQTADRVVKKDETPAVGAQERQSVVKETAKPAVHSNDQPQNKADAPAAESEKRPSAVKEESKPAVKIEDQTKKKEEAPTSLTEDQADFLDSLTTLVRFIPKTASLNSKSYPFLNRLVPILSSRPSGRLIIRYNKISNLQMVREAAVRTYLVMQGAKPAQIESVDQQRTLEEEPLSFSWRK